MLSYLVPVGVFYLVFYHVPASMGGSGLAVYTFLGTVSVVLFFVAFLLFLALFEKLQNRMTEKKLSRSKSAIMAGDEIPEPPQGFFGILKEYVKAIKTQICPILEVKND